MTRCYPGLLDIQLHRQWEFLDIRGKDGPEKRAVFRLRHDYM